MHRVWNKPKIRQEWGAEQDNEKISMSELFFDLIFVALVGSLAVHLRDHHSIADILHYFAVWVVFYITWGDLSFYMTRFTSEGLFTDATLFLFTLSVCFMVVEACLENQFSFNLACAASKVFLSTLYLHSYVTLPRARFFSKVMGLGALFSGACFVIAAYIPVVDEYWWYGTALAAYIYADIAFSKGPDHSIPINIVHYTDRVGGLVMLILGESVISITTMNMDGTFQGALLVSFGYLIIFSTKTMYFGGQPHDHGLHALRTSVTRGRSFVWLHMLLIFFILAVGSSLKLMAVRTEAAHLPHADLLFLGFSVSGLILFMNLIRLTHNFGSRPVFPWIARVLLTLVSMALPLLVTLSNGAQAVIIYSVILTLLNAIDLVSHDSSIVLEEADKPLLSSTK